MPPEISANSSSAASANALLMASTANYVAFFFLGFLGPVAAPALWLEPRSAATPLPSVCDTCSMCNNYAKVT